MSLGNGTAVLGLMRLLCPLDHCACSLDSEALLLKRTSPLLPIGSSAVGTVLEREVCQLLFSRGHHCPGRSDFDGISTCFADEPRPVVAFYLQLNLHSASTSSLREVNCRDVQQRRPHSVCLGKQSTSESTSWESDRSVVQEGKSQDLIPCLLQWNVAS